MAHIAVIVGTPSARSRLNGVLGFIKDKLMSAGHTVGWINVRDLPPEDLIYAKLDSEPIMKANEEVERADAVVVATPVFKASYTGVLKSYLDLLPQHIFDGKAVLPVAIGGTIAHFLVLEYALKPVLSALGGKHIIAGVYAVDTDVTIGKHNDYNLSEALQERLSQNLQQLVESHNKIQIRRGIG
jgi:FMN reductase